MLATCTMQYYQYNECQVGLSLGLLLAGCVQVPVEGTGQRGGTGGNEVRYEPRADIPTASDDSERRRRARIRLELASTYYAKGQYTTALDEVKSQAQLPGLN